MSIRIAGQVVASAGSLTAHNHDAEAHPEIRALIEQGGGSISVEQATEEQAGIVALASQEEALEAFDDSKAMTPLKTAQKVYESVGRVVQLGFDGTLSGNILTFEPDTDEPYEIKNGYSYEIDLLFPAVVADGQLDENIEIVINNNGESIKIVNALHDATTTNITVGEMKQIMKYSTDIGFRWIFNARFTTTQSGDKVFVMPSTVVNVEGSASVPDNVYTSDNLIAGKNVTFTEVPPEGGIDEHTLACWHFDGDKIDVVNGLEFYGQDPTIDTTQSKFGTGSLKTLERRYYWSTSNTQYGVNVSSLSLTTQSNITIDFWLQLNYRTLSSYVGTAPEYMAFNDPAGGLGIRWDWDDANKIIKFKDIQSSEYSADIQLNSYGEWHHVAYVHKGVEKKSFIYFDGKMIKESSTSALTTNSLTMFNFWRNQENYQPVNSIDEARISDILRYTEDFTPPTKAYTVATGPSKTAVNAIIPEVDIPEGIYTQTNLLGGKDIEIVPEPVEGGIDENTVACWHFDGKNTDEVTGLALENIGIYPNNPYDTSRMKFGTACIYDFYSSTLKTNDISSLNLTDTDWTLDLWFYQTNYQSSGSGKYGIQTSSKNLLGFKIYKYEIRLEGNMWGKAASTSVATSTQTTWTHAALQYDHLNNKGYFFINGQKVYEGDVTDVTGLTFKDLYLGRISGPSLLIDELRISNVLRWKEDFEVPTKAYEVAEPTGNMVVNYTGKAVDLSGKADTNLGNISENIDYVVESYNDGTNWYRLYKSGWIEQGGRASGDNIVTLIHPMNDTNYTVICVQNGTTGPTEIEGSPRAGVVSNTQVYIVGGASTHDVNYYVCGQADPSVNIGSPDDSGDAGSGDDDYNDW